MYIYIYTVYVYIHVYIHRIEKDIEENKKGLISQRCIAYRCLCRDT